METTKLYTFIGLFLGGTVGSAIPALWGANMFSLSSIILGGIGSIAGIWFGFVLAKRM